MVTTDCGCREGQAADGGGEGCGGLCHARDGDEPGNRDRRLGPTAAPKISVAAELDWEEALEWPSVHLVWEMSTRREDRNVLMYAGLPFHAMPGVLWSEEGRGKDDGWWMELPCVDFELGMAVTADYGKAPDGCLVGAVKVCSEWRGRPGADYPAATFVAGLVWGRAGGGGGTDVERRRLVLEAAGGRTANRAGLSLKELLRADVERGELVEVSCASLVVVAAAILSGNGDGEGVAEVVLRGAAAVCLRLRRCGGWTGEGGGCTEVGEGVCYSSVASSSACEFSGLNSGRGVYCVRQVLAYLYLYRTPKRKFVHTSL